MNLQVGGSFGPSNGDPETAPERLIALQEGAPGFRV